MLGLSGSTRRGASTLFPTDEDFEPAAASFEDTDDSWVAKKTRRSTAALRCKHRAGETTSLLSDNPTSPIKTAGHRRGIVNAQTLLPKEHYLCQVETLFEHMHGKNIYIENIS